MALPVSEPIQFIPGSGRLDVDQLVDPSGAPINVLDIDVGFTVNGRLELPGWLSGRGVVRLTAYQHGGPIDKTVGEAVVNITGATTPNDPPIMKYNWSVTVKSPTLPDEDAMYQLGVIFAFQTPAGGHTDIGGFYDLGPFLVV
jgi:hypothetical protein